MMTAALKSRPVGRLAPTPSGHLHLGNVLAFGAAWLSVRSQKGRLLLRFEDVDIQRSRMEIEASQREDLVWLGIDWDEEVPPQRDRKYDPWLQMLTKHTYACQCTRRQIQAIGGPYSGTCRNAGWTEGAIRFQLQDQAPSFYDRYWGAQDAPLCPLGDPVLRRRDGVFAYNLAVIADDIADGVTEVVRGADLLDHTPVHIQILEALCATPPTWLHTPLILGPDQKKLSKSHGSTEVKALKEAGWTPADIWRVVLPWLGLPPLDDLSQALSLFDPSKGPRGPIHLLEAPTDPGSIPYREFSETPANL